MGKFTPSQTLRLRLLYYWKNTPEVNNEYDEFEDFYTEVLSAIGENLEVIVHTIIK